jgi:hypothetical protein
MVDTTNGEERPIFNEEMAKQRIQRYTKRLAQLLAPPKLTSPPAQPREEKDIPF